MTKSESLKEQIAALDEIISGLDRQQSATADEVEAQEIIQSKQMVGDLRFIRQKELDELATSQNDDSPLTSEQVESTDKLLRQLQSFEKKDRAIATAIDRLRQITETMSQLQPPQPSSPLQFAGSPQFPAPAPSQPPPAHTPAGLLSELEKKL